MFDLIDGPNGQTITEWLSHNFLQTWPRRYTDDDELLRHILTKPVLRDYMEQFCKL